ncbi:hypothetical protein M3Y99_01855900 [Aphelenchoides fujianensis]|nr:hypothetical protein M3Y99_01855900 [Aphelenchoides fujianensis]
MVSAGFAATRASTGGALPQSQAQYLKEAFGVPLGPPAGPPPASTTDEWPSLSVAAGRHEFPPGLLKNPAYGADFAAQHRALAHTNSLGRMPPNNPLVCRRPAPIGRPMEPPRPLGTPATVLGIAEPAAERPAERGAQEPEAV